jgi:LysM repeat protein
VNPVVALAARLSRRLPLLSFVVASALLAAACGTVRQAEVTFLPDDLLSGGDIYSGSTPVDSVSVGEPEWPTAPPGASSPAQWEALYQDALDAAAAGELAQARDLLFVLQELTEGVEPARADTLYLQHRRSVQRRIALLGGLLAEQTAFAGPPLAADSVLTMEYLGLEAFAFPDSLVPATGTRLPSLQADLLKVQHAMVDRWLDYFTGRGRRHFQIWFDRKAEIDSVITPILVDEGLPAELISLAMIESGLSTRALSSAGAHGPWQFMPGTARRYGLRIDWWQDQRRDWELSTRAACRYLKDLHAEFGDWALVLASYNTGEGRVRRQLRLNGHDNYWDYRLPRQTVEYVPKFIAAARIVADPEVYGFAVRPPESVAWDEVTVDDATDLSLIAASAGVAEAAVAGLNPSLLRGATPPGEKGYRVRVPAGTAAAATVALARIPPDRRLTWRKHAVQRGETLSHIAARWGTSVQAVQEANGMGRSTLIRPGDQLLIPMPRELSEAARQRAEQSGRYLPPSGHERVTYRVKPGDTLGSIARSLGVSVAHLKQVNNIRDPHRLQIGQTLAAYRAPGRRS